MATRIFLRFTAQVPEAGPSTGYRDMLSAAFTSSTVQTTGNWESATLPNGERQIGIVGNPLVGSWWSERFDSNYTISGTITFNIWARHSLAGTLGGLRARLYKVPSGGSNLETLICESAIANISSTTSAKYIVTCTPTSTVVAAYERLILRLFHTPDAVSGWGTESAPQVQYDEETDVSGNTWIELTETVTFVPNVRDLYPRRTSVNGIGNFFDLLPTLGASAYTTGVVDTAAGGTLIQWTRTAGGTVLEWITPRMRVTYDILTASYIIASGSRQSLFWRNESNALANVALQIKLYRRKPDGTELLFFTSPSTAAEMGTTLASQNMAFGGTLAQATTIYPDDRIVCRPYIFNKGTMAAGHTATLAYDNNVLDVAGNSFLYMLGLPQLKAESEPNEVASRMTMGGVGG